MAIITNFPAKLKVGEKFNESPTVPNAGNGLEYDFFHIGAPHSLENAESTDSKREQEYGFDKIDDSGIGLACRQATVESVDIAVIIRTLHHNQQHEEGCRNLDAARD